MCKCSLMIMVWYHEEEEEEDVMPDVQ